MRRFRVTNEAQADLESIWWYVAQDNVDAADRLNDHLFERFQSIADLPHSGRARNELREGVRSYPAGSYVIFYRSTTEHVEIVRVIHGARDIDAMF